MMGDLHVFGHSCCDEHFRLREENARLRQRVEELEREAKLNRAAAEKHYAYGEAQKERAEAAEAMLAEAQERVEELERENAEFRASLIGMHERAEAAEHEVERLRGLISEWSNAVVPDWATGPVGALEAEAIRIRAALAPEVKP